MKIKLIVTVAFCVSFFALAASFNNSNSAGFFDQAIPKLFFGVWGDDYISKKDRSPEGAVKKFVKYLADGECNKALKMAISSARESVMSTMDAGCEKYETQIVSATCETGKNVADCVCTEKRDGLEMTYEYKLRKLGKDWKIEEYKKDLQMDESEDFEYTPKEDLNSK